MLKTVSLILSLIAFFAAIWIVVPALSYNIWLFSVAASEWSLWIGTIALIAIIISIYTSIFGDGGKFWIISLIISSSAFLIAFYPFFSVLKLAKEENVSLSFTEYFSGLKNEKSSAENFSTHNFADVDGKKLQLDVYLPQVKNDNNGASVIVVHGGSWNAGERNDFPQWNEWLAANGYTVFDIDYRLMPQPNYLTATADVKCAVLWTKEHAKEFNISPERIAILGRSAGAHLALLAAYSADDPRLPPSCQAKDQNEKVRAVVSFYAPTDLIFDYENTANQLVMDGPKAIADFVGGNPDESAEIRARLLLASPTSHVSRNTPPTLLVHGGEDQLVRLENMQILNAKLKENGVPHKTIFIPYAQHGFDYNIHGWGSQITKSVMLDFLREHTAGR